MRKMLAKLLAGVIIVSGFAGIQTNSYGVSKRDVKVTINLNQVDFPDGKPYIDSNGRVLVPIRFVSEALNAKVAWDKQLYTVVITTDGSEPVVSKPKLTVAGMSYEDYDRLNPYLKKLHDERFFKQDSSGFDLTQPESVLNPKGLLSERQILLAIQREAEISDKIGDTYEEYNLADKTGSLSDYSKGTLSKYHESHGLLSGETDIQKAIVRNNIAGIEGFTNILEIRRTHDLAGESIIRNSDYTETRGLQIVDGKYRYVEVIYNHEKEMFVHGDPEPFSSSWIYDYIETKEFEGFAEMKCYFDTCGNLPNSSQWYPVPDYWN